ncbi:uncharacterized protein LOC100210071 isoform X2 [Hydra vulgaris]|uniref:Uncharacterized protein LOC100210071 isoform X2 n=1 Tax=Hydra vulgaris TaxID=6087 RepID=A0ABM4CPB3_HYDVU
MSILYDPEEEFKKSHSSYSRRSNDNYQSETAIKYDDLLVFGYECKLFRDDQQAESVNKGETLIPWMGDKMLLIDRYDCRGHLYHIEEFDFSKIVSNDSMSPEELEIEKICDEERYMSLNKDMINEDILKEEEEKRINNLYNPHTAYQTIDYSYSDDPSKSKLLPIENAFYQYCQYYGYDKENPNVKAYFLSLQSYDYERPPPPPEPSAENTNSSSTILNIQKPDKFVPPEGLIIPAGMEVPETSKMQSIVEKTALFISKQGTQMEIVLKAKQSGNAQFDFLSFDNWLNPYYKFILQKIKSGEYKLSEEEKDEKEKKLLKDDSDSSDENSDNETELHPLLQAHRRPLNKVATTIASITNYVPKSKPTGKIEDLAKIYMSMKYSSEKEEEKDFKDEGKDNTNEDKKILDNKPESQPILPISENNAYPLYPLYPSDLVPQSELQCPSMPHMMNNVPIMLDPSSYHFYSGHNIVQPPVHSIVQPPVQSINPLVQPPINYRFQQPNSSAASLQSATISKPPQLICDLLDRSTSIRSTTSELSKSSAVLRPPGPLLPPQVMPLYKTSHLTSEDSDESLQPPGVELESSKEFNSNLPPPPPLPPPPTIEVIKKKVISNIQPTENVCAAKTLTVENSLKGQKNLTTDDLHVRENSENENTFCESEPVNLDSKLLSNNDRYKPSSLLSKILNSRGVSSSLFLDRLYHGESNIDNFNDGSQERTYNLHPDFSFFETNNISAKKQKKNEQKDSIETMFNSDNDSLNYKKENSLLQSAYRRNDSLDRYSANDIYSNSTLPLMTHPYIPPQSLNSSINAVPFIPEPSNSQILNAYVPSTDISKTINTLTDKSLNQHATMQNNLDPLQRQPEENYNFQLYSSQSLYADVIIPPPDLQPVIDRLALYVVKNGDEFEEGIKLKEDPRFDFLNSWNMYNKYYTQQKFLMKVEIQKQKEEDEERKRNMKVSFGLKTKSKAVSKKASKVQATAIFNQNEEEEEEESLKTDGFKPNKDKENEMRRKQETHDCSSSSLNLHRTSKSTPQQIAQAKRFTQAANLRETQQKMQEERKKKAASFVVKLKNTDNVPDGPPAKRADTKKDAFFEAINQAFKGI